MSKLSAHILDQGSGPAKDFCLATQPGFVKAANEFGAGIEIASLVPGLRAVGRTVTDYDANAVARSGISAVAAADYFVNSQQEKYNLNPAIKIWEGPNEPVFGPASDPTNVAAFQWYATFESKRIYRLADMGLQAVTGNFSMGTPDIPLWDYWGPVWAAHRVHGGWTGVHEYQDPPAPTLLARILNLIQRRWGSENDWTWLFLRVTRAYATAARLGYPDARFLITECGTATGWLDLGLSSEVYAQWLARYDAELRKLPYVDGAFIFTSGRPWGGFLVDNHPVLYLLAGMVPVGSQIAPPVEPTPEPVPLPEYPRDMTVTGFWGANIRRSPWGTIVGWARSGSVWRVVGEDGPDWRVVEGRIHKSLLR